MAIKLLVLVNFVIALSFKCGFGEEICVAQTFKTNCSRGEFVLIEGAFLGRFSGSTCYPHAADQPDCFSDMKTALQERVGANDSISFSVADDFFYGALPSCHPSSLPFSLNISLRCAKVFDVQCSVKPGDGTHLDTIEGSNIVILCNVRSPQSSPPDMQWFRNGINISPVIIESYPNFAPTTLKTRLLRVLVRVNASDDGALFSCRVALRSSSNADELFVYYWNFTASVWHGPNNIRIDPVKAVYVPGDRIHCHADGNPDPVFTWRSVSGDEEDLRNGSVLTLLGAAPSGSALALECTATNLISGVSVTKTMNVTIRSDPDAPLPYRYLIVGASCGFVILVFLIAGLIAALMRCRAPCVSDDDLYIVQPINSNKRKEQREFEHVNVIYSNDSSEGEEEGGGGGRGGEEEEEVVYAEADDICLASCRAAPSKRRLPGDGCVAGHEATVTSEENDYLNVDGDNDYYDYDDSRSPLPLHKDNDKDNRKDNEKDEQEYLNVNGVNEYSTLPPTVTTFRSTGLTSATEYVVVDHTACRRI